MFQQNETVRTELSESDTTVNYEDVSCVLIEDDNVELAPVEKNQIQIGDNDSCQNLQNIPTTKQKQIPYSKLVDFFSSKVKPLSDRKLEETSTKPGIIEETTPNADIEMEEVPKRENEDNCEPAETKVPISSQVSACYLSTFARLNFTLFNHPLCLHRYQRNPHTNHLSPFVRCAVTSSYSAK